LDEIAAFFGNLQRGVGTKGGNEITVHEVRKLLENPRNSVMLSLKPTKKWASAPPPPAPAPPPALLEGLFTRMGTSMAADLKATKKPAKTYDEETEFDPGDVRTWRSVAWQTEEWWTSDVAPHGQRLLDACVWSICYSYGMHTCQIQSKYCTKVPPPPTITIYAKQVLANMTEVGAAFPVEMSPSHGFDVVM
jgi:hypothetical protein